MEHVQSNITASLHSAWIRTTLHSFEMARGVSTRCGMDVPSGGGGWGELRHWEPQHNRLQYFTKRDYKQLENVE